MKWVVFALLLIITATFISKVPAFAQTTNNPALEYDSFSGVSVIASPNYSTGVDIGSVHSAETVNYLGFSNLTNSELSVGQIKALQSALKTKFPDARYIGIEKSNIKTTSGENLVTTRVQVDRSANKVFDLSIHYIPGHASSSVITLKQNSTTVFAYIVGLYSTTVDGSSFSQKDATSHTITISTGNKEGALRYISSLGYRIPDLLIVFNNYENPFL